MNLQENNLSQSLLSPLVIDGYCRISNHNVILNGKQIEVHSSHIDANCLLTDIYKTIGMQYPKFFKMDYLAKSGIIAAELLLNYPVNSIPEERKEDYAVICFNSSSSLDDDLAFQKTIANKNDFFPSPAIFVYTLANIVVGEIAIRHHIIGETTSYIQQSFHAETFIEIVCHAFMESNQLNTLIGGWVEYLNGNCDVLLLKISKQSSRKLLFTTQNINQLYHL